MTNFSKCKNFNDVFAELNKMADEMPWAPKKQGMGDKFALIGVNAKGAEFITYLDRPIAKGDYKGFDKLVIYKEYEVVR